mmetsp:Transcript_20672/g.61706  ORF Transcript_20672/g.61706 Transcript_20672/m.61706 type:complete len:226 (+) Transcript_20672:703-1380(+)
MAMNRRMLGCEKLPSMLTSLRISAHTSLCSSSFAKPSSSLAATWHPHHSASHTFPYAPCPIIFCIDSSLASIVWQPPTKPAGSRDDKMPVTEWLCSSVATLATWLHCIFAKVVLAPPLELSGSPSEAKGFGLGDNAGLPLVPRGLRDAGLSAAALPASHAGCGGTGGRSALSVRPLADVLVSWKPPPRCSAPIVEGSIVSRPEEWCECSSSDFRGVLWGLRFDRL